MLKDGYFTLNGKKYFCYTVNGRQFVEGKTVDEFLDTLDPISLCDLAKIGIAIFKGECESPSKMANELNQARHN